MTQHIDSIRPLAVHRRQEWLGTLIGNALGTAYLWTVRRRSRRSLAALAGDPHLLRDIGLTRAQARREAAKWFWTP